VSHPTTSAPDWWNARRLQYNLGLAVAGVLAFIAYVIVGSAILPPDAEFEVTIFTTLVQGIGYLFMIAIANVFYGLGPWSERVAAPSRPGPLPAYLLPLGLLVFGITAVQHSGPCSCFCL
jgi:hypothetical protein